MSEPTEPTETLGPCCICETVEGVRTIVNLPVKCPTPGRGWGCVVCNLPSDGAVSVVCDACVERLERGEKPKFACKGYPAVDGRVLVAELKGMQVHDKSKHAEFNARPVLLTGLDAAALNQLEIGLRLNGFQALQILGAVQLVCRHPDLPQSFIECVAQFGQSLQEHISVTPNLAALATAGWEEIHDVRVVEPSIIIPARK